MERADGTNGFLAWLFPGDESPGYNMNHPLCGFIFLGVVDHPLSTSRINACGEIQHINTLISKNGGIKRKEAIKNTHPKLSISGEFIGAIARCLP